MPTLRGLDKRTKRSCLLYASAVLPLDPQKSYVVVEVRSLVELRVYSDGTHTELLLPFLLFLWAREVREI